MLLDSYLKHTGLKGAMLLIPGARLPLFKRIMRAAMWRLGIKPRIDPAKLERITCINQN